MFSSPTEYRWDQCSGSSYRASSQLRYDIAPQARFPYGKDSRLIQLLRNEGLATAQTLNKPAMPPRWWLELVQDSDYVDRILTQTADDNVMRRIRLPLSSQLADRARISVGGGYDGNAVLLAQRHALLYRAAGHIFRSMIGLANAVSAVSH